MKRSSSTPMSSPSSSAEFRSCGHRWFSHQPAHLLFLTATVLAELWYGIELKPEGARRNRLTGWLHGLLRSGFADSILPFDSRCRRDHGPSHGGRPPRRPAAAGQGRGNCRCRHGLRSGVGNSQCPRLRAYGCPLARPVATDWLTAMARPQAPARPSHRSNWLP